MSKGEFDDRKSSNCFGSRRFLRGHGNADLVSSRAFLWGCSVVYWMLSVNVMVRLAPFEVAVTVRL